MTEWYEKAYPGGPMVGPPLTRPLYPPDAATRGKTPSTDGKDVIAIKRAVSRGGRWPWGTFDDSYSNGFAHGTGGNVVNTGVEGVQRQNGIDATGWIGEQTYNLIRSARIPTGLPHAGEPLLDQTAVNLLEEFRTEYLKGDTVREQTLTLAKTFVGYKEYPPGTNGNMFGAWYGINYEPWCAIFVTYCFEQAGPSPSFVRGSRWSYCPAIVSDARAGRNGLKVTTSPIPGDVVVYDWGRNGEFDHAGIFDSGTSFSWTAIEGNTSGSNNSNGGEVQRRSRSASDGNIVFVRVAEP